MFNKYPMIMRPAFKDYLWGGNKLVHEYGKETSLQPVAESWELSCHKDGASIIDNGVYSGKTLRQYLAEVPEAVGRNNWFSDFPILIKLIDANKPLSVQVHPGDTYARIHEHDNGKTELWIVLSCKENASLVYGVNRNLTKDSFLKHIHTNTLRSVLNEVAVNPGDVFFVPPGTLHAIGSGILVAEIQQSSNTTYRVWDYGRVGVDGKPRQLHVEKAIDVTKLSPTTAPAVSGAVITHDGWTEQLLAQCAYFKAKRYMINTRISLMADKSSYTALLCVSGEGKILYHQMDPVCFGKGRTVFIPAGMGEYIVEGSLTMLHVQTL